MPTPETMPTGSRVILAVGTALAVAAFVLRAAVGTPITLIHNALAPYFILELPLIFVAAFLWLFIMLKGRIGISFFFAFLAVLGYWVLTTGIGFV